MPSKVATACIQPGCPGTTTRGQYCDQHSTRAKRGQRGTSTERGYDYRWAKARAKYIARHPLCQRCGTAWSEEVHHVDRQPTGPRRLDFGNLEALCGDCHREEHR